MGQAIARRLQAASYPLVVYNRSDGAADEIVAAGGRRAATPAEAFSAADVTISVLADGPAVETVLLADGGALSGDAPGTLVEMSTVGVDTSIRVAERAAAIGVPYLRAPVSGNPSTVDAGKLTILISGPREAYEAVEPVLSAIGPTHHLLGDGDQARIAKLALNLMVAGTAELLAEALVLGEAHGLARADLLAVVGESAVGSPFVRYKTDALLEEDYTATFTAALMAKDLGLIAESASGAGVPTPVGDLLRELMDACVASGMGALDFMALLLRLEREGGRPSLGRERGDRPHA